jgi:hypothetical protein
MKIGNGIVGRAIRSDKPLTENQIMTYAPSAYAERKHESRSERYMYIPTSQIIKVLEKEGFYPFFAVQGKSRIEGKECYTKHMLRFRPGKSFINKSEIGEIILLNSHDGTSSYRIMAGIFRFVCQNGLVSGDVKDDYRIYHKGNIADDVLNVAYDITDNFSSKLSDVEKMKAIDLEPTEQKIFADTALSLRYDDEAPVSSDKLLWTRRLEDRKKDLWTTCNVIQENIIKGGLPGRTKNNKRTKTREVKNIDNNIKLNKALWSLTERMLNIKNGSYKGQ